MASYESMFKPEEVAIYDPIISGRPKELFPVLKGGVETTERTFTSSTFSNSSTQFSVPPPNPSTFVSRRFMLKQPVTITITGTTTDNVLIYQTGYSGFRQSPLASIMQTLDVVLNGQSVSLNMNDVIKPLLLYHNNERDLNERELSMSPLLRDQSQQYADLTTSNRNPLEGYATTGPRAAQGRGAFSYDTFDVSGGPDTVVITATLTEELYLSPLLFGGVRDQGFIGLQKIDLNFTWDNNLDKIWSHTLADTEDDGTYAIDVVLEAPSILFRYVTPPLNFVMPPFMQYSYNEIQRYPTSQGALASGASFSQMASSNIQLNSIPRYIYLFARERNADFTFDATDSYMGIDKCQINWNNNNALLSNATVQQLYDISRKNGVDLAWNEWSAIPSFSTLGNGVKEISGIGGVLCLEFGTDIGLREDEAPGMIGTYNLQVVLDITNRSDHEQDITMYIITIIPGIFSIYQNSASKRIGLLSKSDVINAKTKGGLGYYDLQKGLKSGGFKKKALGGKIGWRGVLRKATKVAKLAAPAVAFIPGIGAPAAMALQALPSALRKAYGKKGQRRRKAKRAYKAAKATAKYKKKYEAKMSGQGMISLKDVVKLLKKGPVRRRVRKVAKRVKRRVAKRRRGGAPVGGAPVGGRKRKVGRPKKRGGKNMSKAELARYLRAM